MCKQSLMIPPHRVAAALLLYQWIRSAAEAHTLKPSARTSPSGALPFNAAPVMLLRWFAPRFERGRHEATVILQCR